MKFLELVAKDILEQHCGDLSETTVVFPNLRSRIFFDEYLMKYAEKTSFAPRYESLDSLFASVSKLKIADSIMLISILYKHFVKHYSKNNPTEEKESFDDFFYFGQIILSDFNDIDTYLKDASKIYNILSDLENLNDNFAHLNEEQIETINRFFGDIGTNKTELKEKFRTIWSVLGDVYTDFKQELQDKGISYQGMLCRDVIDNLANVSFKGKYVFVGFNILTPCDEQLMRKLKPQSLFYWDYDNYRKDQYDFEAWRFIKQNMRKFPQKTEFDRDNISKSKQISIISASNETAQMGYIPYFIDSLNKKEWDTPDTAIIFANEQMLLPALSFIPKEVGKINVTMGFPLNETPIYDFIIRILELQQKGVRDGKFYFEYVLQIFNHCYAEAIIGKKHKEETVDNILNNRLFYITPQQLDNEILFKLTSTPQELIEFLLNIVEKIGMWSQENKNTNNSEELFNEAIFRAFQVLNRLKDLILQGYLDIKMPTMIPLLKKLLMEEKVPFHGEPARGLQLMGMLETRNMDYKNIVVVSLNEGIMPKVDISSSFIPHFIRKSLEMSNIEHQDSIYAYYFYRLLQRVDNVAFIYNTASQKTSKSEMSRFLMQITTELPNRDKIRRLSIQNEVLSSNNRVLNRKKSSTDIEFLKQKYIGTKAQIISPSAINTYINCGLKYYYTYVKEIKEPDELSDSIDKRILGNILHKTMEIIYLYIQKYHSSINFSLQNSLVCDFIDELDENCSERGRFEPFEVKKEHLEAFISQDNQEIIDNILFFVFDKEFFCAKKYKNDYNGEQLIYFSVANKFVINTLKYDCGEAPFVMIDIESFHSMRLNIDGGMSVNIGGYIDRIRLKNNVLYVEDYKTSSANFTSTLDKIFDRTNGNRNGYALQALYYSLIMFNEYGQKYIIVPQLIYSASIRENDQPLLKLSSKTNIDDFNKFNEEVKKSNDNTERISTIFENLLKKTISEIFNIEEPFYATEDIRQCQWCDFKTICGRIVKT